MRVQPPKELQKKKKKVQTGEELSREGVKKMK